MSFYYDLISGAKIPNKTGSLVAKRLFRDGNRVYAVTTAPTIEPVSLAELKTYAKIDYDDEDRILEKFIESARVAAEEYTGRAFIKQTIDMNMDYWPGTVVELPRPPLMSVTKVATVDEDGTETTFVSTNYYIQTAAEPGKLVLRQSVTEPINTARDYGGFLIRYVAGYGNTSADVPGPIKDGVKIWAAVAYSDRVLDPKNPPPEAKLFLDLYRLFSMLIR